MNTKKRISLSLFLLLAYGEMRGSAPVNNPLPPLPPTIAHVSGAMIAGLYLKGVVPPLDLRLDKFRLKTGYPMPLEGYFTDVPGSNLLLQSMKQWNPPWPLSRYWDAPLNTKNALNDAQALVVQDAKDAAKVYIAIAIVALVAIVCVSACAGGYYGTKWANADRDKRRAQAKREAREQALNGAL